MSRHAFTPTGPRLAKAFAFANAAHREQTRKQTVTPYISHLMCVAGFVLEYGGDETQAVAALLHDAVEDQGGLEMLERIRAKFGDEVAQLVSDCTEPLHLRQGDWAHRKSAYLAHLATLPERSLLIVGCDKVHNAMSLVATLESEGISAFERFNGKAAGTRWWYEQLADKLGPRLPSSLGRQLTRLAQRIAAFLTVVREERSQVTVQKHPLRYWPAEVLPIADCDLGSWKGQTELSLSGGASAWIYAFLGARAGAARIPRLLYRPPDAGRNAECSIEELMRPNDRPPSTPMKRDGTRVLLQLEYVPNGKLADHLAIVRELHFATKPGDQVVLTGRGPVYLYAFLAYAAALRGAIKIGCITPIEGMALIGVHGDGLGTREQPAEWVTEALSPRRGASAPVTFGVIGYPNSGKSVLSGLIGSSLESLRDADFQSWVFPADPAAPTPDWYLKMLATDEAKHDRAIALRQAYKVDWTPELAHEVGERLRRARPFFDRVIVDLPGGDTRADPPDLIPKGREELFRQVDRFIVLNRPDIHSGQKWIDALASRGLADRVHAVIDSADWAESLSFDLDFATTPIRGTARGLDRRAPELSPGGQLSHKASRDLRRLVGIET